MSIFDNALTLITLLSLFLLGPALGRAMVACLHGWQDWSLPIQHLAVGICTMIAVTGMVFAYGGLWKLSPKSVAWYAWIPASAGGRHCEHFRGRSTSGNPGG